MKLGNLNAWVTKPRKNPDIVVYDFGNGSKNVPIDSYEGRRLLGLMKYFKGDHTESEKYDVFKQVSAIITGSTTSETSTTTVENTDETRKQRLVNAVNDLMNFFSEFQFEPNFRFMNTFAYACKAGYTSVLDYVTSYFELSDSGYLNSIKEKIKSQEFKNIAKEFRAQTPSRQINTRFKLYYGSAGTGKTTQAMSETDGNCMVCHSAMLPADLMEDFKFIDGKADFQPSVLQIAMTEGKKIVLDEINLLPFESLRFLQTVLDGKKEFMYKGKTVHIADGFQIIGTMNLVVNGCVYSLPEPLIDRCSELKKYKLSAEDLVSAVL